MKRKTMEQLWEERPVTTRHWLFNMAANGKWTDKAVREALAMFKTVSYKEADHITAKQFKKYLKSKLP
jgi:hypothetical protein